MDYPLPFRTCRILRLPSSSSSGDTSVIRAYLVLFNECNLANLLETVMFHASAAASLGDDVVLDVTVCTQPDQLKYP